MGAFVVQMTDAGAALLARAQTGTELHFTSVRLGAGTTADTDYTGYTALIDEKLDLGITRLLTDGAKAKVRFTYQNSTLATGFNWTEAGLMAADPDNPGTELLYAYGYAATPDYIPDSGTPYEITDDFISVITNAETVSATINDSLVYALASDLAAHIGEGGEDQHPAATTTEAGFMSATDKTKLDGLSSIPGYLRQMAHSSVSTLANFNAATKYDMGQVLSLRGDLVDGQANPGAAYSLLYSMVVSSNTGRSVTLTIPYVDDNLYIYVNGSLIATLGVSNSVRTQAITLSAGENRIQFLLNNSAGHEIELAITAWYVAGVTWLRAATS